MIAPLFSRTPRPSDVKTKFNSAPVPVGLLVQSSGEVYFSWRIVAPAYCHTFRTFLLANLTALLPAAARKPKAAVAVGPPPRHTSCP